MKKFLMIAFTAMLMPILALAQFSITGKISDGKSKLPLAGATVSLNNAFSSAQTNAEGNYTLKNLKAGKYTIRISYVGYNPLENTIMLTENTTLNLELRQTNILTDEVIVKATRAENNSATTFRNLNKADIEKNNLGQDLPYLLNQTPSVVVSSDAGAGVGYTGIRIRGSDATRINLTINGIPLNDSESQGTFLVNLPDFASSIDNIQIQRGVGTSTNGAGAFGASINVQTTTRRDSAYAELNNSFGSYKTLKNTVNVGTGMINGKLSLDGRLSRINSDGYMDNASSKLKSYFLSGAYYGKNNLLRANVFSGTEKTYQAWNGVPEAALSTNRTMNVFTYNDQTDNYSQDHYQLLYSHAFSPKVSANVALHYTYGRGYYEEYKDQQAFADYKLQPLLIGTTTIDTTNLIRRRWLDNNFYGTTYSLNYTPKAGLNFILGGAYNEYDGKHYGEVIWAQHASNGTIRHPYYDNDAFKTDFNIFGKIAYQIGEINLFADLQYRHINYSFLGFDNNLNNTQQKDKLNFFNPKVGLSYQMDEHTNFYASFAIANKEPNRDDYVNSTPASRPKAENLKNIEVGYRTSGQNYNVGLNGYAMLYKDQLILTGEINDVGSYTRQNVPDSYRMGLELDGKWQITNKFSWGATASLSQNKIKKFEEFIDNYDDGTQQMKSYTNTDIGFSPAFIASSELSFKPFHNAEIALLSKYVGKQYLDNTSNSRRSINSFFVNDLRLHYNIANKHVKNIGLTLLVNNLFSELYEANGYTFSYVYGGPQTENWYYPQATRNFLASLTFKF